MQQVGGGTRGGETLPNGGNTSPTNGRAIQTTMRWSTPTSNQVCRDFMRNVCQRGARCKYMHFLPPANGFGAGSRLVFCRDYQSGSCKRTTCKFIHRTRSDEEYYNQTGQLPVVGIGGDPLGNVAQPVLNVGDSFAAQLAVAQNGAANLCTCVSIDRVPCTETPMVSISQTDMTTSVSLKRKLVATTDCAEKGNGDTSAYEERAISANGDLKRKILELETKCRDLAAANELLLEQNARFRIGSSPLPCSSMALSLVQPVYTATSISTCANAFSPPAPSASNPNTSTVSVSHSRPRSVVSTSFAAFTSHASPVSCSSGTFASAGSVSAVASRSTPAPAMTLVPSFVCSSVPVPVQLHSTSTSSANESAAMTTTTLNVPVNMCSVVPCANGAANATVPVSVTLSAPVTSCSLMVAQPAVGILSTSLLRTAQIGTLTVVASAHDAHVNDSLSLPIESHSLQVAELAKLHRESQPTVVTNEKLNVVTVNENEH